jgi:hypothetical protein
MNIMLIYLLLTTTWFSLVTLVSSTNKIDIQDTTEILLKVALNTINQQTIASTIYFLNIKRTYHTPRVNNYIPYNYNVCNIYFLFQKKTLVLFCRRYGNHLKKHLLRTQINL